MRPDLVAAIYKLRWQIELLFKQLKQNFPLKYFLGVNENAIKIQIYCALIANLLMKRA
jgi:IS4 transposase